MQQQTAFKAVPMHFDVTMTKSDMLESIQTDVQYVSLPPSPPFLRESVCVCLETELAKQLSLAAVRVLFICV